MSSKPAKSTKAKRPSEVSAESRSIAIENDVAAFLSAGGNIEKIPTGVSGQTSMAGPKHISLGNKPKR